MHFPHLFKKESWQRFLAGCFVGAILSFIIFLYMHGRLYEQWATDNLKLQEQISNLELKIKSLSQQKSELDEQAQEQMIVQEIEIILVNQETLKLDRLLEHQTKQYIKEQISDVLGKKVSTIASNGNLLKAAIQNKQYTIDDMKFTVSVKMLTIAPVVRVEVELELKN
ncbi:sporulation membrane protein YtrI [Radiobacillus deserti]|uniref:Sporulation membrane protein YtrI C-terminal domain-containing protein n=1 Tax=Radiobacillus deserti TaxID=2594883 RepID=A0A516KHH4_9BACI|nr:sporulation membrane protein YtrI [Radiobacillus deserti]QDP40850.1 hypothetical protein FN924_12020 [Radiobacillus deserti]